MKQMMQRVKKIFPKGCLWYRHKVGIVKKESRETKHFIRMIAIALPELKSESQQLWKEAKELHLIINSIDRKVT